MGMAICIILLNISSLFAQEKPDKLVLENNAFAVDLYKQLRKKEGNIIFSPYSISTALSMAYAGARGETQKEMSEVLHFPIEQSILHPAFYLLQNHFKAIQKSGEIQLNIANSMWVQEDFHFLKEYLDLNKKYYGSSLYFADFIKTPDTARSKINKWVEKETNGRIKNLIDKTAINSLTRLVLCNAVYFKGDWFYKFDKGKTRKKDFWVSSDKSVKADMMSQKGKFKYMDYGDFKALSLPYKGKKLSMIIFLPKKVDGLQELEKKFNSDNMEKWIKKLKSSHEREIVVELPKFKALRKYRLSKELKEMGMKSAFSPESANFSGMTGRRDLYISNVIHKAFINVDEEGSEAAAATAVVVKTRSIANMPLKFSADHPFVFFIRDEETGSILFLGRIVNPNIP